MKRRLFQQCENVIHYSSKILLLHFSKQYNGRNVKYDDDSKHIADDMLRSIRNIC